MDYFFVSYKGRQVRVPVRDSRMQRAYDAENGLRRQIVRPDWNLPEWREVEKFVRDVTRSVRWKKLCALFGIGPRTAEVPVKVVRGRANAGARGNAHEIIIPPWAQGKIVVLHELAHAICGRVQERDHRGICTRTSKLGHQWPWAMTFIALCSTFLGADFAKLLKQRFKANGVRCSAPPNISEATRQKRIANGKKLQAAGRARAILTESGSPTPNQEATS